MQPGRTESCCKPSGRLWRRARPRAMASRAELLFFISGEPANEMRSLCSAGRSGSFDRRYALVAGPIARGLFLLAWDILMFGLCVAFECQCTAGGPCGMVAANRTAYAAVWHASPAWRIGDPRRGPVRGTNTAVAAEPRTKCAFAAPSPRPILARKLGTVFRAQFNARRSSPSQTDCGCSPGPGTGGRRGSFACRACSRARGRSPTRA